MSGLQNLCRTKVLVRANSTVSTKGVGAVMARRSREPSVARMYLHDVRLGDGTIVSTTCEGAECIYCAADPAAAKRAKNPYFPWEPGQAREPEV